MTAIFEEIRRLEAARKKGDISAAEFAEAKGRLLATVEDATVLPPFEFEPPRREARRETSGTAPGPWGLMLMGLAGAGLLTLLAGQLIGDLTIAFTLVATVFAAIVIAAFRKLES
ncbi:MULTISPECIES: SHOCT domain-containing protein [unclassified Leisingera]|uniref:SHOCT domain-containing protein n=1 Tax=unclassified Leisingera TaxID=2614906 RepID=UPI001010BB46|nr:MULTISPECIES: SHOCT domain-containing protein [unclassified Leisingera]MBQ4825702.1 SHOCT domain-containing protein [Leisingera sp. HS039]QAX27974.1 SHOCT domain-containing protein [Leisingera sp. NJS204]QBR37892.1 SHOCT domain-containing protein [Leisingera sp. NJS201]